MAARRRQSCWQTWLVLVVLSFRALLAPGFMIAPATAAEGLASIVICTPNGMQLISVGRDGQPLRAAPDGSPSSADADNHCPFGAPPSALIAEAPYIEAPRELVRIRHQLLPTHALIAPRMRFRLARGPPRFPVV